MQKIDHIHKMSFDSIGDLQKYLLRLLSDFDSFCRENKIEYSLNGGSLLGSIRHKGFIPWDDDVDIMFDRDNYEKFMEVAKISLPKEYEIVGDTWVKRLKRKDNPNNEFQEGFIDLFVMDNIPDNKVVSSLKNLLLKTLQGMLKVRYESNKYSFINKLEIYITHILGKFFSINTKQRWYSNISKWGDSKETKKMNIYNSLFSQIGRFAYSSDMMNEYIDIPFEDIIVRGIKDYKQYLTVAYGNYMELPPAEKRKPIHFGVED